MSNFTENRRVYLDLPHSMLGQHWSAVDEMQLVDPICRRLEGSDCGELVYSL